ncbi:helix-turn-helix domain-containing protein [Aestuariibaculum suncheonense]|uniref:Helix-turn-helix domain-containing protein n=1 Tax=Aestuariibaculum suncheonense TaxID=1028745 RepID=A0A8J6QXZ1_9FLAO|nr:helix-turn-helix domain-containing protein [Aestuariibaculum suncheonense]MBD0836544.1 helix-turn-helix domain-containing protein [Aestuariibaculum suncheonense]
MSELNLAQRVKALRNRKGLSQEDLAEASGLSLRTIQRIENNETEPRGDTLRKLSEALDCTPEDIIDWKIQEDKGYLTFMSISSLSFLFFPILGIIIPLILWILKKDKLKGVDKLGKAIMNFQITWVLILFSIYLIVVSSFLGFLRTSGSIGISVGPFKMIMFVFGIYGFNILVTVINTIRVYQNKSYKYIPAIPILR